MSNASTHQKDLYKVLGVLKTDDAAAVKRAYRKLAKELHPDKTKGDKKLEARFKEVSEAYEILSDPKKRAEYEDARAQSNSTRSRGTRASRTGGGTGMGRSQGYPADGTDDDVFANFFGGRAQSGRGADIQVQIEISFKDAIFGCALNFEVDGKSVNTKVPAGVMDETNLRVRGRGNPGKSTPGDLYILLKVRPHPALSRIGDDLLVTIPVTFVEAALGADIQIPTLSGGKFTVRLAAGTQNGRVLRVTGRGVKRGVVAGDLLIKIEVQVPQGLSDKSKSLLEEFGRSVDSPDPRRAVVEAMGR